MSLTKIFINDPEKFNESMTRILSAEKPALLDRDYLLSLGFEETNAILFLRLFFIMGLIDEKNQPTGEFERLASSEEESRKVIAEKVWEGYTEVFSENSQAYELHVDKVCEIFRKIHGKETSDTFIRLLAMTFKALVSYANWNTKPSSENRSLQSAPAASANKTAQNGSASHRKNGFRTTTDNSFYDTAYETDFLEDLMEEFSDLHSEAPSGKVSDDSEDAGKTDAPGRSESPESLEVTEEFGGLAETGGPGESEWLEGVNKTDLEEPGDSEKSGELEKSDDSDESKEVAELEKPGTSDEQKEIAELEKSGTSGKVNGANNQEEPEGIERMEQSEEAGELISIEKGVNPEKAEKQVGSEETERVERNHSNLVAVAEEMTDSNKNRGTGKVNKSDKTGEVSKVFESSKRYETTDIVDFVKMKTGESGDMEKRSGFEDSDDVTHKVNVDKPATTGASGSSHTDEKASLSRVLLKRAELLATLKRNKEAIRAFDQLIETYSDSDLSDQSQLLSQCLLRKAELLEADNQFEEALLVYEEFINRFYSFFQHK